MVAIYQVDAAAIIQTRAAVTLIYLVTADGAHVARITDAGIRVNAILTLAVVAGVRITVVNVLFTQHTSESCGTLAFIAIWVVNTLCPI